MKDDSKIKKYPSIDLMLLPHQYIIQYKQLFPTFKTNLLFPEKKTKKKPMCKTNTFNQTSDAKYWV